GLVCPVLKPQGTNTGDLAKLCYATLRAGADIVKEDHGLANQPAAPFRDRVPALAQAAARANAKRADAGDTTRGLYFATMNGHGNQLHDDALFAKQAGADGVLIMPGLFGYDAINCLARDPEFGLPIMAHPSHLGAFASSADNGYSHGMLFGTLARLAGADISIFPNVSGRFGYSHAECREIAAACTDPSGHGIPILPSPGGGMTLDRMADMRSMYGDDCVYLLGGGLLRLGDRIGDGVREMIAALSA
ncbi:MAG TPA: ribulose 1,5-bisphosphate carboxylase, partial [Chromatiaceae bacterium]|nr:ribulose 1,5-bisphosphate carboxylase [Chromatiaceae bacterium]